MDPKCVLALILLMHLPDHKIYKIRRLKINSHWLYGITWALTITMQQFCIYSSAVSSASVTCISVL